MKALFLALALSAASPAFAAGTYSCEGVVSADKDSAKWDVKRLVIADQTIDLELRGPNGAEKKLSYVIIERKPNGWTRKKEAIYATVSGAESDYRVDSIGLPHFGLYDDGVGSEISLAIDGERYFGHTTACRLALAGF